MTDPNRLEHYFSMEEKIKVLEKELDRAANEIHRLGMKCSTLEDAVAAITTAQGNTDAGS